MTTYRFRLSLVITLVVLLLLVLTAFSRGVSAESVTAIARESDPVVLTGADFPSFLNAPIGELAVYTFDGANWNPIPFQIDEITSAGVYTGTGQDDDDGFMSLFDANDEIVFMATDADSQPASTGQWVVDDDAQNYVRYKIDAVDPLSRMDTGLVYLYRSSTLPTSPTSYVAWNGGAETLMSNSYTLNLDSTTRLGISDIFINGSPNDILDRQRTTMQGSLEVAGIVFGCLFPTTYDFDVNEVDLARDNPVSPSVIGPVRVVTGNESISLALYRSRIDLVTSYDLGALLNDVDEICSFQVDDMFMTFNWNDPAITGIDRYYNSNGQSAMIDGSGNVEGISSTPVVDWLQVNSSSASGIGGMVLVLPQAQIGNGSVANYYRDNVSGGFYGDSGLRVMNFTTGVLEIQLSAFILPAGTNTNVGATYHDQTTQPITASAESETIAPTAITLSQFSTSNTTAVLLILSTAMLILASLALTRKSATFNQS